MIFRKKFLQKKFLVYLSTNYSPKIEKNIFLSVIKKFLIKYKYKIAKIYLKKWKRVYFHFKYLVIDKIFYFFWKKTSARSFFTFFAFFNSSYLVSFSRAERAAKYIINGGSWAAKSSSWFFWVGHPCSITINGKIEIR